MSLLSATDIAFCTGILSQHFDLFATTQITVHKEPIRQVTSVNSADIYAGYPSNKEQVETFTPVSGVFPAMVRYNAQDARLVDDLNLSVPDGQILIRVRQDARDYIELGKTERIEFNGQSFNINSTVKVQNYLNSLYYFYLLKVAE